MPRAAEHLHAGASFKCAMSLCDSWGMIELCSAPHDGEPDCRASRTTSWRCSSATTTSICSLSEALPCTFWSQTRATCTSRCCSLSHLDMHADSSW